MNVSPVTNTTVFFLIKKMGGNEFDRLSILPDTNPFFIQKALKGKGYITAIHVSNDQLVDLTTLNMNQSVWNYRVDKAGHYKVFFGFDYDIVEFHHNKKMSEANNYWSVRNKIRKVISDYESGALHVDELRNEVLLLAPIFLDEEQLRALSYCTGLNLTRRNMLDSIKKYTADQLRRLVSGMLTHYAIHI